MINGGGIAKNQSLEVEYNVPSRKGTSEFLVGEKHEERPKMRMNVLSSEALGHILG